MQKIFILISLMFGSAAWAQPTPVAIEFILDASGSMAATTEGQSQMEIAKKSIKQTLVNIPANVSVALRAYGHRVPKSDKENSCKDTELAIPFGPLNRTPFTAKLDGLSPNGYTPIAFSLKEAAKDFLGKESEYVIILVSDGEETCGGDPVAEAKNLLAQGFKVTIHTIGFRVDAATKAQLIAISNATGGSYYDAGNAASLTQNLTEATHQALVIAKEKEKGRGQEIRGGDQYESAVLIEEDIEYHLDHHQKQNQYDYLYVPLKKGQKMTVTITTQDHGVDIYDNEARENTGPYAGFRLVGPAPDYERIYEQTIIGTQHGKKSAWGMALQDGRYYVLIGNAYHAQHKNSPFKLEITDHFDADTGADSGDDIAHATAVAFGEYAKNWLMLESDTDIYQFSAQAREAYTIKITPADLETSMGVQVFDQDRIKKTYQYSPSRGAVLRIANVGFESGGPFYVEIKPYSTNTFPVEYALSVQKTDRGPGTGDQGPTTETGIEAEQPKPLPEGAVAKTETVSDPTKGNTFLYVLLAGAILVIAAMGLIIGALLKRKK